MLAIFFLEFNLKDCIEVQQKKKKSLSCVHVRQKTWEQAVSRRSCAVRAKKCTKKRAELLFCSLNLLFFWRTRCRRRRGFVRSLISLIKVQNLNSLSTTGHPCYIYSKHEQLCIQLWAHRKENKIKRNKKTNRVKQWRNHSILHFWTVL